MFDDILGESKKDIKSDFYVDKHTGEFKRWIVEYGEIVEQSNGYIQLYPDPTPEELDLPEFNAVWNVIKSWDVCEDGSGIYHGACANNVKAILDILGISVLRMYANKVAEGTLANDYKEGLIKGLSIALGIIEDKSITNKSYKC